MTKAGTHELVSFATHGLSIAIPDASNDSNGDAYGTQHEVSISDSGN